MNMPLAILNRRRRVGAGLGYSNFIPSGSDSLITADSLTFRSRASAVPTGEWVVVGTVVEAAPLWDNPAAPSVAIGIVSGAEGFYQITNSTTSTVTEAYIIPPFDLGDYGAPGDTVTAEYLTFSDEGPSITLPTITQIMVTAVGTLARSGATVTLTPATWDTGTVTVTRTKTIDGFTTSLTGTTFDVAPGDDYYVTEVATKTGFIASDPAQTATGTRPAATPVLVGSKTTGWNGTVSNQTVSLTDLTGGTDTSPQDGDFVVLQYACGSSSGTPTLTVVTSGYTSRAAMFADDSADTTVIVQTKFMSGTPDTSIQVSGTGATANAGAVTIMVFRGVDPTTPIDVAAVTKTGISGGRPTADPITPITDGAVILVLGAAASSVTATVFTSGLSNFITSIRGDTVSVTIGAGTYNWISGTYTPVQWLGNNTTASSSWAAATLALRPAP